MSRRRSSRRRPAGRPAPASTSRARCARSCGTATCGDWSPQTCPPLSVTGRRTTMLPRGLEPGQVGALLASCDRDEPAGKRDYAVILLLARLGLRAGEAARLRLDDVNWRAGDAGSRGQGGQYDGLPLPADVVAA